MNFTQFDHRLKVIPQQRLIVLYNIHIEAVGLLFMKFAQIKKWHIF